MIPAQYRLLVVAWFHHGRWSRAILQLSIIFAAGFAALSAAAEPSSPVPGDFPDIYTEDVTQFTDWLRSPLVMRRVEGIQGLSNLKHWPAEPLVLGLLSDPSPLVHREAVLAICRIGARASVPHLIGLLGDPAWDLREMAWLALRRITGQDFPAHARAEWEVWWRGTSASQQEQLLLNVLKGASPQSPNPISRRDALKRLKYFATPSAGEPVLRLLAGGLDPGEATAAAEVLERLGSARTVSALGRRYTDAAAWALGAIGGPEAEKVLLNFPKTLPVLINLDRLRSTNAGPFIVHLVNSMGLITYRSQPDDVMNYRAQPVQRAGANLIRRSGQAPLLIELTLQELEDSMRPARQHGPRPGAPPDWTAMFEKMREELKPGFVRNDGVTTAQPLTALYHVATDRGLAARLIPLLRHPAFVSRVYVALTLGKLQVAEALPEILSIISEGYPFSDSVALVSGKHFDQSQTVRWRSFLPMALGRMGGDQARRALEALALDPNQPRDIRYGAVIGLGFFGSEQSLPVLRKISESDLVWMIRDEARLAFSAIQSHTTRPESLLGKERHE